MSFYRYSEFISESAINQFLFEGGAFGHMSHPYDDVNLTFGEIKDLISDALQGGLNKEVVPSEKLRWPSYCGIMERWSFSCMLEIKAIDRILVLQAMGVYKM